MQPKSNGSAGPLFEDIGPTPREVRQRLSLDQPIAGEDLEPGLVIHEREVRYQQTNYGLGRVSGSVALLKALAKDWRLTNQQLATLTGYWPHEAHNIAHLLSGAVSIRSPDQEERIGYLIGIYALLHRVLRDTDAERAWLEAPLEYLGGDSPLSYMLKGSVRDIWTVKRAVELFAGQ